MRHSIGRSAEHPGSCQSVGPSTMCVRKPRSTDRVRCYWTVGQGVSPLVLDVADGSRSRAGSLLVPLALTAFAIAGRPLGVATHQPPDQARSPEAVIEIAWESPVRRAPHGRVSAQSHRRRAASAFLAGRHCPRCCRIECASCGDRICCCSAVIRRYRSCHAPQSHQRQHAGRCDGGPKVGAAGLNLPGQRQCHSALKRCRPAAHDPVPIHLPRQFTLPKLWATTTCGGSAVLVKAR